MTIVITFNLEYGAEKYGVELAAQIIASTKASIALLQEAPSSAVMKICSLLNWYLITFTQSETAIISSQPIRKISEGEHFGIGRIKDSYFCVVHLSDYPYIPFEAEGIKYPPECESSIDQPCFNSDNPTELQNRSFELRKKEFEEIIVGLSHLPHDAPIVVGGDFNEPSHLDWTEAAANSGRIPFPIRFPSSIIMQQLGFIDTFRHINPHAAGYTWPDRPVEYEHRRDRIDFLFVKNVPRIKSSRVIATRVSDHSIVASKF